MPYRILVTALIPEQSREKISDDFVLDCFMKYRSMTERELLQKVSWNDYDAILCCYEDRISEALLQAAGDSLKIVSVMSNGIDNVDVAACRAHGVQIANVPGVTTDAIADYAIALLLIGLRRLDLNFQPPSPPATPHYLGNLQGAALSQLTIGIVGLGQIGTAIARRLRGFGCRSVYYSRQRKPSLELEYALEYLSFEQLLAAADAVIVCCSLNDTSHNLFTADTFTAMKPSAIFINVARGAICNHDDLSLALSSGQIAMALLDVTDPEPLPVGHLLHQLDNCLIFPHIATNTQDSRRQICDRAWQNIQHTLVLTLENAYVSNSTSVNNLGCQFNNNARLTSN